MKRQSRDLSTENTENTEMEMVMENEANKQAKNETDAVSKAKNCHENASTALCMCVVAATQLAEDGAIKSMSELQKMNFAMLIIRMADKCDKDLNS